MARTQSALPLLCLTTATLLALTACGTSNGSTEGQGSAPELTAQAEVGEGEGSLSILAWPGYVEDGTNDPAVDWVSSFEEETGCMVDFKPFGTSDEAVTLMRSGQYDVVSASGDASLRLIAGGDVEPVNVDLVESYEGIYPFLKDQLWNTVDGVNYGVPHGWGANVLMYRADQVTPAPTSWRSVFDDAEQNSGKVTAYDSPIYIADAAVYLMAHNPDLGITNPYALDADQLAAAVDLLKAQREHVGEYWSDVVKEVQSFASGSSVIGTTWQVGANIAQADGADVKTVLPEEGATGWSDTWMIGAESEHKNCAYKWLDHIASPEINAQVAEYFGESPATPAACELTQDASHCETYHSGDEEYASQIWYWTTPVADCIDGRTDVECTDYSEWTKAWTEIKG
ncbi:ABC transporter substrate-binding protein [Arthrobacter burdickii]|jgi:putative spermidine/putrescine transport system substrate-binding protein|uniref:ABC transporter substrate-binding protein n=1 Tax=Arthrobacter burdickii TaxID=3035920 RepID=A0ABT8K354_9MICC|nr:ABC transporter substrate-binding protein [Arthrobacter burdickii]MDN4611875.1 ABC transporter substrate-binding protein [Arthrobacter burdickii]